MATPVYSTVIDQINTYIVANGNNEITANVLNPILKLLADFTNNNIGNLADLTTSENDTIVDSINSLKDDVDNITNNGVKLYIGYDDPNVTPPPSYNYADFYMQLDSGDETPIYLWQWNGIEWTNTNYIPDPFPDQNNIPKKIETTLSAIGSTDWADDVIGNLATYLNGLEITVLPTEIYFFKVTNTDGTYQIYTQLNVGKGLIPDDSSKLFLLVDGSVSSGGGGTTPDATPTVKGKLQLAGDLGGTADAPTVPALANKEDTLNKTDDIETNKTSSTKYTSAKAILTWIASYLFPNTTAKATSLVDADKVLIGDSEDSGKTKTRTWTQIKATLKTYFDTLYATVASLLTKQDISNQIPVSTSQTIPDSFHGKMLIVTANVTLTVPASFTNPQMAFDMIVKNGFTVTWAITSPKVWANGTPVPTVGTANYTICTFLQEDSTNNIMLLGL